MRRPSTYYIVEIDEYVPDLEGVERPDPAAVRKDTVVGASALIAEAVATGERGYCGRFDGRTSMKKGAYVDVRLLDPD